MPTTPTILTPKGANVPNGWPFDAFEFYFEPQPTALPSGVVLGGVMRSSLVITLTSAQLLALNATAIPLLNAPGTPPKGFGSSLVIVPTELYAQYTFGGTAYTLGNADNKVQVEYTGQATNLISVAANGLLTAGVNTVVSVQPQAAGNLAQTVVANLGIEAKCTGTTPAFTLGNGTLTLSLDYDIIVLL